MQRNNRHKTLAAVLIAATVGSTVIALPAQAGERGEYGKQWGAADRLPRHLEALGLSDAQKAQIKALRTAQYAKYKETRTAGKALRDSLWALSPAAPNYTAEVERIAVLMGQEHAERVRAKAALRAQEWAILMPSQQSQLATMPRPDHRQMRRHDKP